MRVVNFKDYLDKLPQIFRSKSDSDFIGIIVVLVSLCKYLYVVFTNLERKIDVDQTTGKTLELHARNVGAPLTSSPGVIKTWLARKESSGTHPNIIEYVTTLLQAEKWEVYTIDEPYGTFQFSSGDEPEEGEDGFDYGEFRGDVEPLAYTLYVPVEYADRADDLYQITKSVSQLGVNISIEFY